MEMKHIRRSVQVFTMLILFIMLMFPLNFAAAQQGVPAGNSISSSLGVISYPTKGQPPSQQSQDEGMCYAWAKQQTGIDPIAVASRPTAQHGPAVGGGQRLGGAARGAAGGAAIGAIAGDAGKGAAIGAVTGTLAGGMRARRYGAAQEAQAQQAKTNTLQHFNRAFGACMEGRGYVVK
jgi:hypothetical protein